MGGFATLHFGMRHGDRARDPVGILGTENDRTLEGRKRPGISVDRSDPLAENAIEPSAPAQEPADRLAHRREKHLRGAGLIDHQLQRLRLIDGSKRTCPPREPICKGARANRLGRDETRLRDGDRGLGNGQHVAGSRDPSGCGGNRCGHIVAGPYQLRSHRQRHERPREWGAALERCGAPDDRHLRHARPAVRRVPARAGICANL